MEENKKMNLWQIDDAINKVIEEGFVYDEETGEVFFTADDLDSLQDSIENKLNNIVGYIKESQLEVDTLNAQAKAINEEFQKRLDNEYLKPANRLTKKVEYLTSYLDNYMKSKEKSELKCQNGVAKYSKSEVCEIEDEEKVKEWIKSNPAYSSFLKIEEKVSKKDIKEYLKDKEHTIDGASIVNNKKLKIK